MNILDSTISSNKNDNTNNYVNILIRDIGTDSNYLCVVPNTNDDNDDQISENIMRSPMINLLDQQSNILSS